MENKYLFSQVLKQTFAAGFSTICLMVLNQNAFGNFVLTANYLQLCGSSSDGSQQVGVLPVW